MKENTELGKKARAIIDLACRKLAEAIPVFRPAIYLLEPEECAKPGHLWTDGEKLYYHSETLVRDYLQQRDEIPAQILHIVTHGLLGHFIKRQGVHEQIFDAVADMKVAALIERLKVPLVRKVKAEQRKDLKVMDRVSLEVACETPRTLEEARTLLEKAEPYHKDDHSRWRLPKDKGNGSGSSDWLEEMWRTVAMQVAEATRDAADLYGDIAGEFCEEFRAIEESGVSYAELIRRFCSIRERAEIDPDSINALWYHLGVELTGDTPIIEPDELREDVPVLDLAVALDTSGSCGGHIMRAFLGELLAILRDAGGPKMEFTLIQCDAEIQSVQTMTREDTVERMMKGMKISGFGGTDFRPVFQYIKKANDSLEGKHFRGLLYLSDGFGAFPKERPDYPVVFLFPREDEFQCCAPDVPKWVTKAFILPNQTLKIEE